MSDEEKMILIIMGTVMGRIQASEAWWAERRKYSK